MKDSCPLEARVLAMIQREAPVARKGGESVHRIERTENVVVYERVVCRHGVDRGEVMIELRGVVVFSLVKQGCRQKSIGVEQVCSHVRCRVQTENARSCDASGILRVRAT